MKTNTQTSKRQLLQAVRRGALIVFSAILAVSAQAAEPSGGIRYSDFLKYGGALYAPAATSGVTTPLVFSSPLAAAEPAGSAVWGAYFGVIGLAVAAVVASDALKDSSDPQTSPQPIPQLSICTNADEKPTFSRAASRVYQDDAGDVGGSMDGDYNEAIPLTGPQGEVLAILVRLRTPDKMGFSGFSGANSFTYATGDTAMAGDAVRAGQDTDDESNFRDDDREYRIYSDGGVLYFAEGESYSGDYDPTKSGSDGVCESESTLTSGRFFLDASYARTRNFANAIDIFRLRSDWRGLIGGKAISIGDFMFLQSNNLRNLHVEHQKTAFAAGDFALHTNSGLRRFDNGNSTMTYSQATAAWDFAPAMQLYAQGTSGLLRSTKYNNGRLRSYTFGMFADAVLRHDDYFHVRVESPLADSHDPRATGWRAAADMVVGKEAQYIRFGLHRQLDGNASGGHVYYTREF